MSYKWKTKPITSERLRPSLSKPLKREKMPSPRKRKPRVTLKRQRESSNQSTRTSRTAMVLLEPTTQPWETTTKRKTSSTMLLAASGTIKKSPSPVLDANTKNCSPSGKNLNSNTKPNTQPSKRLKRQTLTLSTKCKPLLNSLKKLVLPPLPKSI